MSIDYSETFESRIDDIRRDGPNIYTSCLEITDNSIGWGSSSEILISFDNDRMILKIKDNGPKGFGSEESIYRYFKLGEKNDKITTKTIGKYGKGGYKACGRQEGEKRSKYPACRPTPAACKQKGNGKKWGKKSANESVNKIYKLFIDQDLKPT